MKPWSEVTNDEINKVIMRDCRKCRYSAASVTGSKKGNTKITCSYILIAGHMRPCRPGQCRESGIFKKKTGKRYSIRIKNGRSV